MNNDRDGKVATGADWIIPILGAGFATYYLISIKDLAWEAKVSGVFCAVVLFLLIAIFALRTAIGVARGTHYLEWRSLYESHKLAIVRGALFALTVANVALIPWAGFTLSTFGFLFTCFLWLERMSARRAAIVAGSLALFGYVLFVLILRTALPPGPFERLVSALTGF
ncbi:tripartite tricarboxylate transporter TctB family protein [Ancylobacter pratisalsi]|uniref:DUF1468 domain-containing protein n=1 Tax=Ancylobacter pratisalsi TaxID=1745854 RepID=A0A6P1YS82_9HYPH|nr:tripartite tricarboxylate transporter TctB family protein [Ancylobacter pratisalsi]QIB34564.1 hypothetical protein G3A50_13210 [Ancylobacter pratisalsi]